MYGQYIGYMFDGIISMWCLGGLYKSQRVVQEDELGRVVREVIGDFIEGFVDCVIFILVNFFGLFVDEV